MKTFSHRNAAALLAGFLLSISTCLNADTITDAIEAMAKEELPMHASRIEVQVMSEHISNARCSDPLVSVMRGQAIKPGAVTFVVSCNNSRKFYVMTKIHAIGKYPVLTRNMKSGDIITPSDIKMESGQLSELPYNTLMNADEVIGMRVKSPRKSGDKIRLHHVEKPPVVERGQTVKVESGGDGFKIFREGVALRKAGINDPFPVRLNSRTMITAVADASGTIKTANSSN
jgi:flagella basal body P-ring formation protein FlgA